MEGCFGSYRGLSGSSFRISVNEVFESQTKLQLSGYLRAHRVLFGSSTLERSLNCSKPTFICKQQLRNWIYENVDPEKTLLNNLNREKTRFPQSISSYCAFKISREITCEEYKRFLERPRKFWYEFDNNSTLSLITDLESRLHVLFERFYEDDSELLLLCLFWAKVIKKSRPTPQSHRSAPKRRFTKENLELQCQAVMDKNCHSCSLSFSDHCHGVDPSV